jgi:anaerobic magnesium-protoporphyrin IX monomethyl ester cyclase
MKINLIVLPFEENVKSPPICLGYIASLLKKDSNDIKIIDLNFETQISQADLNIVTTTTVDYYNCPLLNMDVIDKWLSVISKIKTPLAVIGPHVTTMPEYFEKYAQYLVVGEPELTIKELVVSLTEGKSLKNIKGLYYKQGRKFIKNKSRELLQNLDSLPFPDRSLIDNSRYVNPVCKNHPYTMVISSRGCPYHCTYCYMDVYGHFWRARSAKNVVQELIEIRRKYNIKEIVFRDDLFSLDKKRVIEICNGIVKNNLDLTWTCQTRVDSVDEEIISKMKEAGCYSISFGIEAGLQEMMNRLKKGIKVEQVKKAIFLCKKYDVRTRGYFIIGCPGETKESIQQTLELAKELDLDYFMLSILTPYPQTEIYEDAFKKRIIKKRSWDEALRCAGIIETPFTFNELVKMKRDLYLRYYFRPGYILPRLAPGKIDMLYHGFMPFVKNMMIRKFRGKKLD